MAESMATFLSSLDDSISRVAETGRTKLATSVNKVRDYCTFRVEVKGGVKRREEGRGEGGVLGRARRVLGDLMCVGSNLGQQEEDEESWLLGEDHRGRRYQSTAQQGTKKLRQLRQGSEQEPCTPGSRAGVAVRRAGRWIIEGLQSYAELGFPSLNPRLSSYPGVEDTYNWVLAWP